MLGRKSLSYLGSYRVSCTAVTFLSLVQSCKQLGIEPLAYLRDVLDRLGSEDNNRKLRVIQPSLVWPKYVPQMI